MLVLLAAAPRLVRGQITETYTFTPNRPIPDATVGGLADVHPVNSAITYITGLKVRLKLASEFNGDLYGYLRHANGFTVLLNRPGKTAANPFGYADSGVDIMLQGGAGYSDVHSYQSLVLPPAGSPLAGLWEPDGRCLDPMNATDASARSSSLANFIGLNAAGDWTLYLTGVDGSCTNRLAEWSLEISGATALNHPPVLAAITNAIVRPDGRFLAELLAADPDGNTLTFSLDPGAPAGVQITNVARKYPFPATNTVVRWQPTRAFASTTNFITVRVTDNGVPPMSATQTFSIIVLDYLELTLGSTNVLSGQSVDLPIHLASDRGVTDLAFTLGWSPSHFANPALTATAPGITSASIQDQGGNLLIQLQTAPGQSLQGTQQVARLSFLALSNRPSAFVPLPVEQVIALKPDASSYSNYIANVAVVAVVVDQPLLRASLSEIQDRYLTVYGRPGDIYQLQYSTNLAPPTVWYPSYSFTQTNSVLTLGVDSSSPLIFYRLISP